MPRVIWSSGNCMLYVRAEPSTSEKGRGESGGSASEEGRKRTRRKEFAKNSRLVRAQAEVSLVMVVEENEREEDEDDNVEEAREKEQRRGERRGAAPRGREVEGRREGEDGEDARGDVLVGGR